MILGFSKFSKSYKEMDKSQASDSEEEITPPKSKQKKSESKAKKTPEKKSYRCDRCNFSSSSKAKYTKHAKSAHSGTVVQCDHCEFKTPYKWNLDRHYKNHLGGGALCCHLCNFSCDIKQSLTVHLQNHHTNVPEEIIESVKRQQIPPKNLSINNVLFNPNAKAASPISAAAASSNIGKNATAGESSPNGRDSPGISVEALASDSPDENEKKVPPLRIHRSLTGLSLGDENNSSDESSPPSTTNAKECAGKAGSDQEKGKNVKTCELCDYETVGEGSYSSSNMMKKHMASQHGIHHKKHHHKEHKRERAASSSPEHNSSNGGGVGCTQPSSPSASVSSPNIPVVPISLPPKKSKGATSPRPGQSASSTNNSPAIHRSQSPMKASEAINAFGNSNDHHHNNLKATAPSEDGEKQAGILNLTQSSALQSVREESAFTPVLGGGNDFTHAQISSLKKPKQRALAQFYQKIKPKFTTTVEDESGNGINNVSAVPLLFDGGNPPSTLEECFNKEDANEDLQKNESQSSSKSNRCQHCRQRCKSTADLAAHLEKCTEASKKDIESLEVTTNKVKKGETNSRSVSNGPVHKSKEDEDEYHPKAQALNGSTGDFDDDIIGFETAPGVGAIHTGKMDEMEYQGYQKEDGESQADEGESTRVSSPMEDELEDEGEEEGIVSSGGKKSSKSGREQTTNRKVYRCPEADCSFWATTASRFHVHIVGHYNLKPFECSECHYKSNWRWDVNKHIRLKTPKDPKHAIAKTLLTHESGQRDYRKYDNYLVSMSLTHSANAKAPDCSTSATKRTKTPKSSPDIQQSPSTAPPKVSPTGSSSSSHTPLSPPEKRQKSTKASSKAQAASGSHTGESSPKSNMQQEQQEDANPMDLASTSSSPNEGRSFVETRMLAGGEIYQNAILKQDLGTSNNDEENQEERDGTSPAGFDLTLKRPRSHPHEEMRKEEMQNVQGMQAHNVTSAIPTKKSRLQQHQLQQQQLLHDQQQQQKVGTGLSGATNGNGNKISSMWQCIKCNFQNQHKDVVSNHIRDQHKPKKGDPVSLLTNNHLIQVIVPEQDAETLMASSTSVGSGGDLTDFSMKSSNDHRKDATYPPMFHENGKVLSCNFCPYTTGLLYEMEIHSDHHLNKSNNYYSCPHCSYSVAVKSELHEHLKLHGNDMLPQQLEIQNRLINSSTASGSDPNRLSLLSPNNPMESYTVTNRKESKKRHCVECPYVTYDISEFQYHRQCHEANNYPFKCHKCSFNVSVKLHLLQHLRVHGIQIDEVGVPPLQSDYTQFSNQTLVNEYENISEDGFPQNDTQDEPLNLSMFANRKPVVIWDNNGVPVEGYKCSVCPQIFQDWRDLKEHELTNNHRSTSMGSSNSGANNSSTSYSTSRQCDSPPIEAMNLTTNVMDRSSSNGSKKSSHGNVKVSNSGKRSLHQMQGNNSTNNTSMPLSSPSSVSSVDTAPLNSSSSTKADKECIYLCDECPARFFIEKELKIHHTFHENKSHFQCPKCSYSARQKDPHLMSHMRVHGVTYQEKTKALLTKFPRGKVSRNTSSAPSTSVAPSSTSAAAAYQAAAAAALSAASLLNLNPSLLGSNFNLQTAAAALTGKNAMAAFGADPMSMKNGLSIACPKCPEKFYSPKAFQQHIEQHSNGRVAGTDYRCRFCDYWAESRKALAIHEIVHTGTDMGIEPSVAKLLSSSVASAFNPVSMMAMVAHQDSPFTAANPNAASLLGGNTITSANTLPGEPQDSRDKSSPPVPDEAYEGNPEFVYPTYMKNGRVKSKRYKCMKCPSAFEKKDQYHTHIGLHGSNQKYKCTVCDYAVTYYANYIQHLKKHENQRNIPTELLNLGRKRHQEEDGNESLLKVSKLTDNGENSSSSNLSAMSNGSGFDSNSENHHHSQHHLHQQQRNNNNGMLTGTLMKCSFCPFICFDEVTLDGHLIHHQENPNWLHVCVLCTFRTSSKKSLKEHSRLHLLNGFNNVPTYPQQLVRNSNMNGSSQQSTDAISKNKAEYINGYNNGRDHEDISSDGSV